MHMVIAHGASGTAASMQAHVEGMRARGVPATAIDLPRGRAETAVPAYRRAVDGLDDLPGPRIIGGQSYGGRVASLLAAEDPGICAGLVCFSYPLHRPGQPDWDERTRHWPRIRVPALILAGESDPFARLALLRRAIEERGADVTLVTYPKLGHSLRPVLDEALDRVAAWLAERALSAAGRG